MPIDNELHTKILHDPHGGGGGGNKKEPPLIHRGTVMPPPVEGYIWVREESDPMKPNITTAWRRVPKTTYNSDTVKPPKLKKRGGLEPPADIGIPNWLKPDLKD